MPRPTSSTTVQRPDLGQLAYEYSLSRSPAFIGDQILPVFEVGEKNGNYPVIPTEALLKVPETARAARGAYNRGDWNFEMDNYDCEEHGWEEPLDDTEAEMYRRFFDAETVATIRAMLILRRAREKRIADMVFNTGNFSATSIGTEWSTAANATPKTNVDAGIQSLEDTFGIPGDALSLIISNKVFRNVMKTAEIKDYLQYTSPHLLLGREAQRQMLADYLGIREVLVGGGVYDSTDKGQSTTIAALWDDEYAMLALLATDAMDLREPCLGRSFLWTADSPSIVNVDVYREEQIRSNIYRVRHYLDEEFVFTGCGYLMSNITA